MNACDSNRVDTLTRTMLVLDELAERLQGVSDNTFTNALLNSAVERLMRERGLKGTSAILSRLAGLIGAGIVPKPNQSLPLSGFDA